MNPTFSIIIPVYNVAPYLRECLDSVLAQTYTDWEAICVDDGSTDGSGEILDEYAKEDKRFRVSHQQNAGVSAARNNGLELIKGEWFLFLDGDDCLREDALETLLAIGVNDTTDCVLVNPYVPRWDGLEIPPKTLLPKVLVPNATKEDLLLGPYAANGYPFSRVYRSSVFCNVRFPVGMKMREDVCYWLDALTKNARYTIIQAEYYLYRQRPDSACGIRNPRDLVPTLESVLHAFRAIDAGALSCADAKKKYFSRFAWPPYDYLCLALDNIHLLSSQDWTHVGQMWREIQHVIGKWPERRKDHVKCWLATHVLTRPFTSIAEFPSKIRHWIGCVLQVLGMKEMVRRFCHL